jgi:hypothetical protein
MLDRETTDHPDDNSGTLRPLRPLNFPNRPILRHHDRWTLRVIRCTRPSTLCFPATWPSATLRIVVHDMRPVSHFGFRDSDHLQAALGSTAIDKRDSRRSTFGTSFTAATRSIVLTESGLCSPVSEARRQQKSHLAVFEGPRGVLIDTGSDSEACLCALRSARSAVWGAQSGCVPDDAFTIWLSLARQRTGVRQRSNACRPSA